MGTKPWNWLKVEVKLIVYIVSLVHDSNDISRTYIKLVCEIMELSLHFCEFILPKEYYNLLSIAFP
jgi:hypothetical protein